ncbi:type II secretion protein F [Glycocaulis albus]|uniref:Type II secretion protein F n=1 Tax=Glycocaulis albus TaxID=1382801 RepID=A0ABQ1Y0R6_9PROT|nr:type II secretion system F family protein [Glycocaulis albus]GGH08993.1 type II secretion protein F [Glycocaulis albus]
MRLAYEAIDGTGRKRKGQLDADGPDAAREMLAERGLGVLSLRPLRETGWRGPGGEELSHLAADLARLSRAGIPLAFGMRTLAQGQARRASAALESAAARLEAGSPIGAAIRESFGERAHVLAAMAEAGEATGQLAACLDLAARYHASRAEFRRKLVSAAVYPAIVLALTAASLGVFFLLVLPRIETALADAPSLPALTSGLLAFGRVMNEWGGLIGTLILAIPLVLIVWPRLRIAAMAQLDKALLGPVGLGIVRDSMASAFCSTFAVMLSSGIAVPAALASAARAVPSPAFRVSITAVIPSVRDGVPLADAFAGIAHLPPVIVRLARLAEESGRLADCMSEAGTLLDRRARERADLLGSLAPTGFLLIAGLVIGTVVAAIFLGLGAIADFGL